MADLMPRLTPPRLNPARDRARGCRVDVGFVPEVAKLATERLKKQTVINGVLRGY
jgi:hypothetical protein